MMGHRERLRGGDEYDAFTSWRKCIKWRSRAIRLVKRKFHRRIRRQKKIDIRFEANIVDK